MNYSDIGGKIGIIGSLGKPLGTIIRVNGHITQGEQSKADIDDILFNVIKVDNKELERAVIIPVKIFPWLSISEPEEGVIVTYIGYETGGMTGIPEKAFSYIPYVATTDFTFSVYFQAIKKIE